MHHQLHTSLCPGEALLSLPQPSLASSLFSNPSVNADSTTDSRESVSNVLNLVIYQVGLLRYGPAVENSEGTSDMPSTFHNPWRDSWFRQINRTKINNPLRCEVCKIDFNSKSVFEDHTSGKRHKKNMQLRNNHSNTILSRTSSVNFQIQDSSVQDQLFFDEGKDLNPKQRKLLNKGEAEVADQVNSTSNNGIGRKKIKVAQPARCEICMINCNTKDVYIQHLSGKKHLRNLEKICKSKGDVTDAGVAGVTAAIETANDKQLASNPAIESQEKPDTDKQECISSYPPENVVISEAPENDTETKKQKHELEGGLGTSITSTKFCTLSHLNNETVFNFPDFPAPCEICMINCNSKHAYIRHLSGKKHLRNLEKLSKSKNGGVNASVAGAMAAIITANDMQQAMDPTPEPLEKLETRQPELINSHKPELAFMLEALEKDIETKKQKCERESGAGTTTCNQFNVNSVELFNLPDFPARCEICLIDCNSKNVYIRHLSGKKHKRNLEKVSKSKNDGVGASVAGAVAAIMTTDMPQAMNQTIEPKLESSPKERMDAHKSGNVVMLEAPEKDIEAKRRRIEPFGCAGTTFFKVCKLCNAPCNSEVVFDSHLHGKKHAAMVKKLAKPKSSWCY